jgi:hypothetical protein
MSRLAGLLIALALVAPGETAAQITLGAGTGVGVLAGDDFDGNEGGTTLNLEAMFGGEAGWQFGGVFQYTSLGLEERSESVGQMEGLGAVRYLFQPDLAQLYLGARGGLVRHAWELEGLERRSMGLAFGPTLGVILPFPGFGFEIAMDARYITFGEIDVDGTAVPGTDRGGVHVGGRVGLTYKLGN